MEITRTPRSDLGPAAEALLAAHHGPVPLVLPNVWDVSSARTVEEAGFRFIATSSRAIAAVFGDHDDDSADPGDVFAFLARIAAAVQSPVTADLQAGLGLEPAELVARILESGIVGCNLEDTDHHGDGVLVDAERQAAFLAAVRGAADDAGVHLVINARVDTFIRRLGDQRQQLDGAIQRGRLYLAAGADCVYPIAATDREVIRELVAELPGPVNCIAQPGDVSIAELAELGARRISFGSRLHEQTVGHLRGVVDDLAKAPVRAAVTGTDPDRGARESCR
jgi:2-methylisocitrate lyase-like PEP mutase family enzyme